MRAMAVTRRFLEGGEGVNGKGSTTGDDAARNLRIGAIFIIMCSSSLGFILPVVLSKWRRLNFSLDSKTLIVGKAFSAGVVVATALVHMYPEANESFGELREGPWAGGIATLAALIVHLFDFLATTRYQHQSMSQLHQEGENSEKPSIASPTRNKLINLNQPHERQDHQQEEGEHGVVRSVDASTGAAPAGVTAGDGGGGGDGVNVAKAIANTDAEERELPVGGMGVKMEKESKGDDLGKTTVMTENVKVAALDQMGSRGYTSGAVLHCHGHGHALALGDPATSDEERARIARHIVVAEVLEYGIASHSILIGITIGVLTTVSEIRALLIALMFHQFFEGIAIGGCGIQARFEPTSLAFMASLFVLSTPCGVAVGILISKSYDEGSDAALLTKGIFDAMSTGILLYNGLVNLIANDFFTKRMQSDRVLQAMSYTALFAGAMAMTVIGFWA